MKHSAFTIFAKGSILDEWKGAAEAATGDVL